MKVVVAAFNQEKALVGAFFANLRMELFQALVDNDCSELQLDLHHHLGAVPAIRERRWRRRQQLNWGLISKCWSCSESDESGHWQLMWSFYHLLFLHFWTVNKKLKFSKNRAYLFPYNFGKHPINYPSSHWSEKVRNNVEFCNKDIHSTISMM